MPLKARRIISILPFALAIAGSSRAEEMSPAKTQDSIETVVVTGQRGGYRKTALESPAPVDVVGAERLTYTGNAELGEGLSKVLPSVDFGTTMVGVVSIVRPVSNRSLGPAYTLVLVNGKRRHNGSLIINGGGDTSGVNPVDLDMLPTSGMSRIEVLKDSAAAQYGTDAIAGVFNIRLDRHSSGVRASVTAGEMTDGLGDLGSWKADIRAGFKLGKNGGFVSTFADIRKRGGAWWPPLAQDTNVYSLPAGRTAAQVAASSGLSPAQVQANIDEANARNAGWDRIGTHNGNPEIAAWNVGYNAELPMESGLTLYSFTTFGERDTVIGNNLRRPNSTASFTNLFPNGFFPLNNTHESDIQAVGGLKGNWVGWDWDYSTSFGRNRNHQFSELTIKPSLGPSGPTYWPDLATFQFTQWTHNLDVTHGYDLGLAAPVQVSAGLEYRVEQFESFAGAELAWSPAAYIIQVGDQQYDWNVGLAASPVVQAAVVLSPDDAADVTRRVAAAYVDLGLQPTPRWFVGLALRGEHYSDIKSSPVSAKINSRFDISDKLAFRGTLGTGFRAPSLTQMAYAQTDGRTAVVIDPITGKSELLPNVAKLVAPTSVVGGLLGAERLRAEKTWNAGLGLVWRPAPNLSVTADTFLIDIKGRIARTGRLSGTKVSAILAANNLAEVQAVEYFANIVDTRTGGLDLVVDYSTSLGDLGQLSLSAAANYSETNIVHVAEMPAKLMDADGNSILGPGVDYFGPDRVGDLESLLPHTRATLTGAWTRQKLAVNLTISWYSEYSWTLPATEERHFGAKFITDLNVSYALSARTRLAIGATNLFDVMPELNGAGSPQSGQGYYGPSAFSPSGAYVYTRLTYAF